MADQEWRYQRFDGLKGEAEAASFLNEPLRQGRGEAAANIHENGSTGLFWLEPGSLGNNSDPSWMVQDFPVPNGESDAVAFLNAAPRQGRGEVSATLRESGTARLIYLEPGSLGSTTTQTWQSADFTAPNSEQEAVNFLNTPARQGPGEASVTPRENGTTRLLWLEPGSLGSSTAQSWQYKNFAGPNGVDAALSFLNASPRQAAGEATGYVRQDGSALVFYLEPGSGG